ncbi:MAG: hypothetical protein JW982_15505 [Spirochaetes bacterium]|nr:hypothetical protein [Spirochaetota bacterium]
MNRTSLNISSNILNKLNETSITFKISKKHLILKIFEYCHGNFNYNNFEYGKLTGYQKISTDDSWNCFRIDFDDTQCDVLFFYKNQYRISLSKLLALGFVLFFDKIIEELSRNFKNQIDMVSFLNSYTRIKKILWNSLHDSFKYFRMKNQKYT